MKFLDSISNRFWAYVSKRAYEAAAGGRLTTDWLAPASSEDSELYCSLPTMRNRSRQMIRDNPHAANMKRIVQDNVVGTGIGLQCQIIDRNGEPDNALNEQIESAWQKWCEKDSCHTAGQLSMTDILRLSVGGVFVDGEAFLRKVPMAAGSSKIPFSLEIIEPDLLLDDVQESVKAANGNAIRLGVEVDSWLRPQAYWMHTAHPGDYSFMSNLSSSRYVRIVAKEIEHLYIIERWPQTRGVPWMHMVLRRMRDMGKYAESELVAARAAANIVGFVIREFDATDVDATNKNLSRFLKSEPGQFQRLEPGEQFQGFSPSRPNANLDAFMRYMLRETAAGIGISYESLSRDYSQSNYSSSRLALLDDRNLWRVLQGWLIRNHLTSIYRSWLDAAVLSGVVDIPDYFQHKDRYQAVRFKPRGWSWVDPAKEVKAYVDAVKNGFMSRSDVIAAIGNGQDREDVDKAIKRDQDAAEALGLNFKFETVQAKQIEDVKEDADS